MFIDNVADEFLHQVFEGDDPGRAAVLIDHDRQLQTMLLQPVEQRVQSNGGRHQHRRTHHLSDACRGAIQLSGRRRLA